MDVPAQQTWTNGAAVFGHWTWEVLRFAPIEGVSLLAVLVFPAVALVSMAMLSAHPVARYRFTMVFRRLFNWRFFMHRSHAFDVAMVFANMFALPFLFGWALLSTTAVAQMTAGALSQILPSPGPTAWDPAIVTAIWALAVILAYEFGYWLDHYLSHMVPILWEFHKVHHAAEVLSPMTNFRVHPIDSVKFYNILIVTAGLTIGLLTFAFGAPAPDHPIFNKGNYVLTGTMLIGHLQHSHIWIPFTGWLGRIVMSPAHHQIHHSANEIHFNKNMGSFLAIFDWTFGTLHVPTKAREKLKFGLDPTSRPEHSLKEGLLDPFADAFSHLQPANSNSPAAVTT